MPHRWHHGTRRAVCPCCAVVPRGRTGHHAHLAPGTRCQAQTRRRGPARSRPTALQGTTALCRSDAAWRGSAGSGLYPREHGVQGIGCPHQASVSPAVPPPAATPR
jgi:hypothetical protein